jgi:hypothetical protein
MDFPSNIKALTENDSDVVITPIRKRLFITRDLLKRVVLYITDSFAQKKREIWQLRLWTTKIK